MDKDYRNGDDKKCYLCVGTEFNKRPGIVRDRQRLVVFKCASCGLVFLSSFDHIRHGFYQNAGMYREEVPDPQKTLRGTS